MATYKGINGFAVQSLASDPSPLDEGQVWYNNTSYAWKLAGFNSASWATGGNMSTARDILGGAGGTTSAALAIGGYPPAGGGIGTNEVESYNGTSWSGAPNLATAAYNNTTTGIQTAALSVGGYSGANLDKTQLYNGTSWTNSPTNFPTTFGSGAAAGPSTAALIAGGYDTGWSVKTWSWNGSAYSAGGNLPSTVGRQYAGAAGTQTAALYFGGSIPADSSESVSYNGSAWTATPSLNSARYTSGSGTQTLALAPGGYSGPGYVLTAEVYNGTTWSNSASNPITHGYQVNSNRASNAPGATGLVFGGGNYPTPGGSNKTEAFTGAGVATKTITTS